MVINIFFEACLANCCEAYLYYLLSDLLNSRQKFMSTQNVWFLKSAFVLWWFIPFAVENMNFLMYMPQKTYVVPES